ncbi:MAG TPA: HAD-IA family hydrolase [Terracidiphilus sp.]|nr:HAD-IA family hydrolase [Terracidiphilus sp.]
MLPFDVILFDVGGVLLTNGWDRRERTAVLDQFGLDHAAFEARHPGPYDAWERDAIAVNAYLDATVFYEPRKFTREEFFAAICAQSKELEDGALGILRGLSASDRWVLGALNNEAREPNEYRFEKFGLHEFFEFAFSSCYLGLRKPEPAIYARALQLLDAPAERVLFIDDREENVAGARNAGMKTIRFTGAEALESELKEFGVL